MEISSPIGQLLETLESGVWRTGSEIGVQSQLKLASQIFCLAVSVQKLVRIEIIKTAKVCNADSEGHKSEFLRTAVVVKSYQNFPKMLYQDL